MYNDSFRARYTVAPIAISENTEPYDTAPHIHTELELLYIKSGNSEISVGDRCYSVKGGEIIIVNPLDVHSVKTESGVYHQRCICFDVSLIADKTLATALLSGECAVCEHFSVEEEPTKKLSEYFDALFSSVEKSTDALLFESAAYVNLIFALIKEKGQIRQKQGRGKKAAFFGKVQEYLSAHFSEEITSETAAGELFYTQSYFCRLFRESFGVSFLEYLSMYRISKAKELLANRDIKISEVAERVGFLDQSYFSRCFRNLVGISPSEYQKNQFS